MRAICETEWKAEKKKNTFMNYLPEAMILSASENLYSYLKNCRDVINNYLP